MKTVKKSICLLLSAVLCFSIFFALPLTASAEKANYLFTSADGKYTYSTNVLLSDKDYYEMPQNGKAYIIKFNGSSFDGNLPETVDGIPVAGVGQVAYMDEYSGLMDRETIRPFFGDLDVERVHIPKSIESFTCFYDPGETGSLRFSDFTEMYRCYTYKRKYSYRATSHYFPYKKQLKSITVDSENEYYTVKDNALYSKDMKILYKYFGENQTSFTVPDSVKAITAFAFAYTSLEKVVLPDNLGLIAPFAFYNSEIEEVNIPSGIDVIQYKTFANCKNLKSINVPKGKLESIEQEAFKYCTSLETVYVDGNVGSWNSFRYCKNLKKYVTTGTKTPIGNIFRNLDIYTETDKRLLKPANSRLKKIIKESFNWEFSTNGKKSRIYAALAQFNLRQWV